MIALNEGDVKKRQLRVRAQLQVLTGQRAPNVFLMSGPGFVALVSGQWRAERLRENREKTRLDGVFLNYFEVWNQQSHAGEFELDKAYLHLDVRHEDADGDVTEMIALHFDPLIKNSDRSYSYKRGPHFHPSGWKHNKLSGSHIALCLGRLEEVCNSLDEFDQELRRFLRMIDDEILDQLPLSR